MSFQSKPNSLREMVPLGLVIDPDSNPIPFYEEEDVFGSIRSDRSCCDDFCAEFIDECDGTVPEKFILSTHYGLYLISTLGGYRYIRNASRIN